LNILNRFSENTQHQILQTSVPWGWVFSCGPTNGHADEETWRS